MVPPPLQDSKNRLRLRWSLDEDHLGDGLLDDHSIFHGQLRFIANVVVPIEVHPQTSIRRSSVEEPFDPLTIKRELSLSACQDVENEEEAKGSCDDMRDDHSTQRSR